MLPLLFLLVAPDTTGYWQQHVTYQITASLDEPSGVVTGHARIGYVNHSPETLRDFYVHQYLNAFRPGSRWAAADSAEQRERFQHLKDPDYAFERITGAAFAEMHAMPAQAHGNEGHSSYPGPRKFRTRNLTNVMAVAITGDYEGVLSVGIGMRKQTSVKVFTLTRPTRVVIDVGH